MGWLSKIRAALLTTPAGRRCLFQTSAIAALLVLGVIACSNSWRQARWIETPHACDWFIFLRQAQLFQQHGLTGGLDTTLRDANSRYLIEKAKSLKSADPHLLELIGPYCHHYRESTDRLSIVSPPGTGLGLSFFPAGKQARLAFMTYTAAVFVFLAIVIVTARRWTVPAIAGVLGAVCFLGMYRFVHDWSIQLTVPLVVAAGYVTILTFENAERRSGPGWAALLGLLMGMAGNARTANILLAIGVGAGLGLLFVQRYRLRAIALALAFALGLVAGYLPTLAANAINAGHPFTSTYAAANTQAFRFDWEVMQVGVAFYAAKSRAVMILIVLTAGLLAVLATMHRRLAVGGAQATAIAGLASLAVSLVFFCLYEVRQPYYPFPVLIYAASTAAFLLIRSENERVRDGASQGDAGWMFRLGAGVVSIGAVLAVLCSITIPASKNYTNAEIDFAIPPRAVVWANTTVGFYHMFLDGQAAVLLHFKDASQDMLIASIAADGVPQFIAADPGNEATVARLRSVAELQRAGKAFGFDVFEIKSPPRVR